MSSRDIERGKPRNTRIGIGQRVGREEIQFEYLDGDNYVRRKIPKALLTSFLTNGLDKDSNLGTGAQPVTLEHFMHNDYLPKCATPRLKANSESLNSEIDLARTVIITIGQILIHEIRPASAEKHKTTRLSEGRANATIKKELRCLGRAMSYAASLELIRKNLLPPVKGLPSADRRWIWLRLPLIDKLLECCPERIRLLVEFMILTGARFGEAVLVEAGDVKLDRGIILIPTEKKKVPPREYMRPLNIESLGPRFSVLLAKMNASTASGRFFPMPYSTVSKDFEKAREKARLREHFRGIEFHLHDLRGTFAVHRAVVVKTNRQLEAEIGHSDWNSLRSYLDRADVLAPEESIFHVPPRPVYSSPIAPAPALEAEFPESNYLSGGRDHTLLH